MFFVGEAGFLRECEILKAILAAGTSRRAVHSIRRTWRSRPAKRCISDLWVGFSETCASCVLSRVMDNQQRGEDA
jgi:hypothetical protein